MPPVILFVFIAIVNFIWLLPYFKTLANNEKRRKYVFKKREALSHYQEREALGQLIEELDFPLATIECDMHIENVRNRFIEHKRDIELFCAINDTSNCFHNYFAIIGNFAGTELMPGKHGNKSITKLYSADILFRKNADNTLTLLSTFPEDKCHDFFIKDFVLRLKEILQ